MEVASCKGGAATVKNYFEFCRIFNEIFAPGHLLIFCKNNGENKMERNMKRNVGTYLRKIICNNNNIFFYLTINASQQLWLLIRYNEI